MQPFFFHPKLVHLPMALAILMPLVALGLLVAWWRGWLDRRAWVIAVALQGVLVIGGVAAIQSGEAEEHRVERVVAKTHVEGHEAWAKRFVWASGGVLALMVVGLFLPRERVKLALATAATVGTLVVLGLGYRVGDTGGALVYRHGAALAYTGRGGSVARGEGDATGEAKRRAPSDRRAQPVDDDDDDDDDD